MIASLRDKFNLKSCCRTLATIGVKEIPCFLITFAGAAAGLSLLNHNPAIELAMALSISFGIEYGAERYFRNKEKCCADHASEKKILGLTLRSFLFALAFGVGTWWAHGVLLHDDDKNHVHNQQIEQHEHHADHPGHEHEGKRINFAKHLERAQPRHNL